MKYISIDELKTLQIDILKSIDAFCRANEIRYSLAFGSLLGAIRHNGYIPWDDDIDIMLLRGDYERFIKEYQDSNYKVVDINNSNSYSLPFAKIYDSRTIMDEMSRNKTLYGIYIDIFPVDNVPDSDVELNRFLKKKQFWNLLHILKTVRISKGRSLIKNAILLLGNILTIPLPIHYIAQKMSKLASKYNGLQNSMRKGIIAPDDNKKDEILPSVVFERYTTHVFEGFSAMIIENYHDYLTASYGDFMTYPPIEKQVSHHAYVAYWK